MKNWVQNTVKVLIQMFKTSPVFGILLHQGFFYILSRANIFSMETMLYSSVFSLVIVALYYFNQKNSPAGFFIFGWLAHTIVYHQSMDSVGKEKAIELIKTSWANTDATVWLIGGFIVLMMFDSKHSEFLKNKNR